jgi:tetratricopeptide (TPR) repeat protein
LAIQDSERALELAPQDGQVQCFCCDIHSWLANYTAAIEHGRRAVELEPGESYAYVSLGHSLLFAGNQAEARQQYQRAIELQPDAYLCRAAIRNIRELSAGRAVDTAAIQGGIALFEQAKATLEQTSR